MIKSIEYLFELSKEKGSAIENHQVDINKCFYDVNSIEKEMTYLR